MKSSFNKLSQFKQIKGFTIIEVIIVLVVAAIIMLMVFLIVPQLQKSQRDTARRRYASQILTAVEKLANDSGGIYSSSTITESAIKGIIGDVKDPSSQQTISIVPNTTGTTNTANYDTYGEVEVFLGKGCDKIPGTTPTGSGRFAIMTKLESGNYCVSYP